MRPLSGKMAVVYFRPKRQIATGFHWYGHLRIQRYFARVGSISTSFVSKKTNGRTFCDDVTYERQCQPGNAESEKQNG
jgi:hypothetical protein